MVENLAFNVGDLGSNIGQVMKIPHAVGQRGMCCEPQVKTQALWTSSRDFLCHNKDPEYSNLDPM